jgi:hypothetical protein
MNTTLRRLLVIGLLGLVPVLTGTGLAQAASGNNTYFVNAATGGSPSCAGAANNAAVQFARIGAAVSCVDGDGTTAATPDTITIAGGIYNEHDLDVNGDVSITGQAGSTIIDAQHLGRAMTVESGVTVSISGLTIKNGNATAVGGFGGGIDNRGTLWISTSTLLGNSNSRCAHNGGAILNENGGTMHIATSTLSDNSAPGGSGGAIENVGMMSIDASLLSGNSAHGGGNSGAILNLGQGTLSITNSTVSGNSADFTSGGINNAGTLTITNSTLSGNSVAAQGNGALVNGGTLKVGSSIIANSPSGGNCSNNGAFTDLGYNLSDDSSCGFSAAKGDRTNTNPQLGGLQDNAGPTWTMSLAPSSPAIDWIPAGQSGCPASGRTTDQRGMGYARPDAAETNCDIGAYEYQDSVTTTISLSPAQPSGHNGWYIGPVTVTVGATDPDNAASTLTTHCVLDPTTIPTSFAALPSGSCLYAAIGGKAVSTNGKHTLYAGSEDLTDNVESPVRSTVFQIDSTPPTITYTGNTGPYTVDRQVTIFCNAADQPGLSGVDPTTNTCQTISGPAYTFAIGTNTFSAQAYDYAGNKGTGQTSFVVKVTTTSLCTLTERFESTATAAIAPCQLLRRIAVTTGPPRTVLITEYQNLVKAQSGHTLAAAKAGILAGLAGHL